MSGELSITHRGKIVAHATVDAEDAERLSAFNWCLSNGYAVRWLRVDGKVTAQGLHREVMGVPPRDPRWVDHRFGDKLDCRKANLRITTPSQNARNRRGQGGTQKCVYFSKHTGRWEVRVHLGSFDSELEANRVAREWLEANQPDSREAQLAAVA